MIFNTIYNFSSAMYSTWPSLFWNQHNRGWSKRSLAPSWLHSSALPSCGPALAPGMCGVRPKQANCISDENVLPSRFDEAQRAQMRTNDAHSDNHWLRISWMPGATLNSEVTETDTLPECPVQQRKQRLAGLAPATVS